MDRDAAQVRAGIGARAPVRLLQFHGDETPRVLRAVRRALHEGRAREARESICYNTARLIRGATALLLDSLRGRTYGGAGESVRLGLIPPSCRCPLILSGGLTRGNVAEAIRRVRPWARGRVERRRVGEGHQGRREDRRLHTEVRNADV